jgi:hypothetical protein
MTLKDDLLPTGKNRVIDLVQAAGVDTSDWGNFARGPKWAAANPRYCYEWSFVQPGRVVVLNLWYDNLRERRGTISVETNMREESRRLERVHSKAVWVKRALKMDDAIAVAYRDNLKLRVILNEGEMRDALSPNAKASKVEHRMLDPIPWTITSYDASTGHAVLLRGGTAIRTVDQFDLTSPDTPAPHQITVSGKVFIREQAVRAAALLRAKGRCEFCGQPGFATAVGDVFLETHHITPLSEGGADVVSNVAALCPNHHREAHHGAKADLIKAHLHRVASSTPLHRGGLTTA